MFKTFEILNFGHAQRRRLRRVLRFVWDLIFVIWALFDYIIEKKLQFNQCEQ
jgi:hypothetical protein